MIRSYFVLGDTQLRTQICAQILALALAMSARPALSAVSTSCSAQLTSCQNLCHTHHGPNPVCNQKCQRQEIRCEVQAPTKGKIGVSDGTTVDKPGPKTPIGPSGLKQGIGSKDGQTVFVRGNKGQNSSGDGGSAPILVRKDCLNPKKCQ